MADLPFDFSPAQANALIARYGSERKAASALGISRSALNYAASGKSVPSAETIARAESNLSPGVRRVVEALTGLVRSASPDVSGQRAEGKRLAAQERSAPGAAREAGGQFDRRMARHGLDVHDASFASQRFDAKHRPIMPGQDSSYRRIIAGLNDHTLSEEDYERLVEYQRSMSGPGTAIAGI